MRVLLFVLVTMAVFIVPVFISLFIIANRAKQIRNKKVGVKFNEEGRMVRSQQLQDAKNQRKIIRRKVSTFSRNKEFDVNQDAPLSEAEKNVLFGK